nr:Chorismate synthase, chloroplastic [Ipomoea batatas]
MATPLTVSSSLFSARRKRRLEVVKAAGNTYGTHFRVTTFGESHGPGIGCVIDGCPPTLPLTQADVQLHLNRRFSGSQAKTRLQPLGKSRIHAKFHQALLMGLPLGLQSRLRFTTKIQEKMPSHADATYDFKYGVRSIEGGGRASARETIGRVAAGAVAKKILKQIAATEIESNIVGCPNPEYAEKMIAAINGVREKGDSVGGVVTCIVKNVPRGLGSPVFDKLEAELAKAVMSIPASIGVEFGSGFAGTLMTGSEHNDEFYVDEHGRIRTRTNRSGGIQGGISNGEIIHMRVAFKPTPTINKKQMTVTRDKRETEITFPGRQEPCVAPRGIPVVEAMVALVVVDQVMAQYSQCMLFPLNPSLQQPFAPTPAVHQSHSPALSDA